MQFAVNYSFKLSAYKNGNKYERKKTIDFTFYDF